jgi:hypothetical protein
MEDYKLRDLRASHTLGWTLRGIYEYKINGLSSSNPPIFLTVSFFEPLLSYVRCARVESLSWTTT